MIKQLKKRWADEWAAFKESKPGERFEDHYKRAHSARRKKRNWFRVVRIVVGVLLAAVGLLMLLAPGPGALVIFLGLGLLGSEFKPLATFLDWAEVKARGLLKWARLRWGKLPLVARVLIVVLVAAVGVGVAWGMYQLFFGR